MDVRKEFTYDKTAARHIAAQRRKSVADKPQKSRDICDAACALVSGNVMTYISIGDEVQTSYLIDRLLNSEKVNLYAPFTAADGTIMPRRLLRMGHADKLGNIPQDCYGTYIDSSTKLDYCITPLVGFNGSGHRIGYGKGCYDRFFAHTAVYKIGLAYDCQMIYFAPDPFDVPLDCCVTEKKVIYF